MKKIGILTGGGDCGGLNAVVKGAAQMSKELNMTAYVIPNGYAGLYNLIDFDSMIELDDNRIDFVNSNIAGSEAGHSRVKIKNIVDDNKYQRIKDGLKKFDLEGLIISGGDDTGSVMLDLANHGIQCIHAPKTMDLDLQSYSVGFDSTVNRIATFAEEIKTTGKTHNRIIVMEIFGRYAGHTVLRSGVAAEADSILIPEIPIDFNVLYDDCKNKFINRVQSSELHAGTYLVLVAEGIKNADGNELYDESAPKDAFGHKRLTGAGKYVANQIQKMFENDKNIETFMKKEGLFVKDLYEVPEVRSVAPGHLVRCGHSSVYDVNFGKQVGGSAAVMLTKGYSGITVIGIHDGKIQYMDTVDAIKQRYVDLNTVAFYEHLNICFGRKKIPSKFKFEKKEGLIERIM